MMINHKAAPTIQLAAVDLDGTLLNDDHGISQRNSAALRSAIELGIDIIIATGKSRSSALDLIETLGIKSPGIYMQGLVTYNADGSVRRQQAMDKSVAQAVTRVRRSAASFALSSTTRRAASRLNPMR